MIYSQPSSEDLLFRTNKQPERTIWFLFDRGLGEAGLGRHRTPYLWAPAPGRWLLKGITCWNQVRPSRALSHLLAR